MSTPYPMVPTLPPRPPDRMGGSQVAWAVWLGCTTPRRLAGEWGISAGFATSLLRGACLDGLIDRIRRGHYSAAAPAGVAEQLRPPRVLATYAADLRSASPAA